MSTNGCPKTTFFPRAGVIVFWWLVTLGFSNPLCAQQNFLTDKLSQENVGGIAADATRFGDPVRGAIAFFRPEMNCSKCHEPKENGRRLGPDLTERRDIAIETLIESVLHPSVEIRKGFETTLVTLANGRQISGILAAEDGQQLKLDRIEESTEPLVIDKAEIDERRLMSLSTMPEALANQLGDRNEFLDLIRYLDEIARGGPPRAAQLRPTTSMAALAPLPEYETHIDHRGFIESWDQQMYEHGAEVFRLRCASCHGDLAAEGTMPTSLRFPSGKFKRGCDPYSLYQTLTHGYGMMNPQRWMVPEQKYAVIHYIRETFLREANPSQYFNVDEAYLAGLPLGETRGPKPVESQPWTLMNYGPSLINTIEVSGDRTNIAQKGIAIRLDDGPGGVESGTHWLMYDHDTMRVAGAWSGDFIDYNGIHFNGVHGQHPRVAGTVHLQNPDGPGWGRPADESFADDRLVGRDNRRYGPLDRSWAQYRGMFRFGRQTIIKYTVGNTDILETPGLQFVAGRPTFVRTLNIGPREKDLVLQVAREGGQFAQRGPAMVCIYSEAIRAEKIKNTFDGRTFYQVEGGDKFDTDSRNFSITARIKTEKGGTIWSKTVDQPSWVPNGQSMFLRDGRLTLDIGWVGAVQSNQDVADGKWHAVAMTWRAADARVSFYVDGKPAGGGFLKVAEALRNSVIRIGSTNENFPDPSFFSGEMANIRLFQRLLSDNEIEQPTTRFEQDCFGDWPEFSADTIGDAAGGGRPAKRFSQDPKEAEPIGLLVTAVTEAGNVEQKYWIADDSGNLRLRVPAGPEPVRMNLNMTSLAAAEDVVVVEAAAKRSRTLPSDLSPLIKGGPSNWPEVLETELQAGNNSRPFAVDLLTHPQKNPANCRLRMTGLDFIPHEDAMVVSTWDGSIWLVRGVGQTSDKSKLTWRRIAVGLFQPLGIKIRDGIIFVTCRDQLVALHDLNGDGEMDWYECFNNDHQVTEHFHEFAMGLQTDADGNFYYAKSARHALPAVVPHHGTLLKVSADGQKTEIIASGFRAANGVCLNPDGSFVVTDQEGHWNPKNRINWVTGGGFYGNMFGHHDVTDPSDSAMEPPLCWITNSMDRSPAELLWVDSDKWGPLAGSLLNFSYGYGKIYVVPHEKVNGQMQGGVCAFDLPQFPTGVMRGRFSRVDGQLYCCGMFAWSGTQEQPGGLYRVRYLGGPVNLPIGLYAIEGGLKIEFSDPISKMAASDAANFAVQTWDLHRSANYGSEHYNEHRLDVKSAELLADGKTIRLSIPDIAPTWCMEVVYAVQTMDGKPLQGKIHNTIHALGKE